MVDVEIFPEENRAVCKSDKRKEKYEIRKDRSGFITFEFHVSKGPVPELLTGKFTTINKAIKAFEEFDRKIRHSQAVKNEEFAKSREKRRAKLHSESS